MNQVTDTEVYDRIAKAMVNGSPQANMSGLDSDAVSMAMIRAITFTGPTEHFLTWLKLRAAGLSGGEMTVEEVSPFDPRYADAIASFAAPKTTAKVYVTISAARGIPFLYVITDTSQPLQSVPTTSLNRP